MGHGNYNDGRQWGMGLYGKRLNPRLTQQEQDIIKVAWESFRDAYGFITTERLSDAFKAIDALQDIQDIQLLIDDIDENGDGKIDQSEFEHIMTRKFLGEEDDSSLVHSFRLLDEDNDGYITFPDLRNMLMKEGSTPLSEQEVDELMMFADSLGNGLIDYEDFLRWLTAPRSSTLGRTNEVIRGPSAGNVMRGTNNQPTGNQPSTTPASSTGNQTSAASNRPDPNRPPPGRGPTSTGLTGPSPTGPTGDPNRPRPAMTNTNLRPNQSQQGPSMGRQTY